MPLVLATEVSAVGAPGWCAYEASFEDAPDIEVFCGGLNSKLPSAAAIWRQGHLMHFGFEQDPGQLNDNGRALLANCIDYIARCAGDRPLGTIPSSILGDMRPQRVSTVASALARDGVTPSELASHFDGAVADTVRGMSVVEIATWFETVSPYLRSAASGKLTIDDDARALGLSIRDAAFPVAARLRLAADSDATRVVQLLRRMVPEGPDAESSDAIGAWDEFLARHHEHLFFSESAGYVWSLDPLAAQRAIASKELRGEMRAASPDTARWRALFDGESLAGWHQIGADADYRVAAACIVGTTKPQIPNSFLRTDDEFGDFVLEFDFFVDPTLNSGVQLRSEVFERTARGYQCEIDPSARAWTGGIYDERRRGWIADLAHDERARDAFVQSEWNRVRVFADGPRIRTWINGVPAADLVDGMSLRGFIALQVHGVGKRAEPLEVRWRNLQIRELGEHRWVARDRVAQPASVLLHEAATPWSVRFALAAGTVIRFAEPSACTISADDSQTRRVEVHRLADRLVVRVDGASVHDATAPLAERARLQLVDSSSLAAISAIEVLERVR